MKSVAAKLRMMRLFVNKKKPPEISPGDFCFFVSCLVQP